MLPKIQNENDFYNLSPEERNLFLYINKITLKNIQARLRVRQVKNIKDSGKKKPTIGAISMAISNSNNVSTELIKRVCKAAYKVYQSKLSKNN
jgi:hypothetical protein